MTPVAGLADSTIQRSFGEDHRRLRVILATAIQSCRQAAHAEAQAAFDCFARDLRHHIRAEDEGLFPIFEANAGLQGRGPTAIMRREHRDFERRLDAIGNALDSHDELQLIEEWLLELQAMLLDHDRREERILYPMCDRFLSRDERAASVLAIADVGGP